MCADLDGYPVWLDDDVADDGMFRITVGNVEIPWVVVDPTGPYRRHTCDADPEPIDLGPVPLTPQPTQLEPLNTRNAERVLASAARTTAAISAVVAAQMPLSRLEREAAVARLRQPDASCAVLAAATGINAVALRSAFDRIRRRARQLVDAEATP
jgi:hypothetical protein